MLRNRGLASQDGNKRARKRANAAAARAVATEMTRGQHSTFGHLTYSASSFLHLSFLRTVRASFSRYLPPTSFDSLARTVRARERERQRESFPLIAPCAHKATRSPVLFVCHPPATCFALSLNARGREEKRQTDRLCRRGEETVPGRTTRCNCVWKVSSARSTCRFDLLCENNCIILVVS